MQYELIMKERKDRSLQNVRTINIYFSFETQKSTPD